jgi:uncharacterized membrane-anchored protein
MDPKRLNYLVSTLNRVELTQQEKQFIQLAKGSFNQRGKPTEEQEVIFEGICKEKLRWIKLGLINE